ncbi:hypothetical protein X975_24242, partial [Stegodyphus mimosarum]
MEVSSLSELRCNISFSAVVKIRFILRIVPKNIRPRRRLHFRSSKTAFCTCQKMFGVPIGALL